MRWRLATVGRGTDRLVGRSAGGVARGGGGSLRGSVRLGERGGSARPPLEPAPLALGESAPDAEALVVPQGVLEAVAAHVAPAAHLLGLPRRPALLREESLRVGLGAQGLLLPRQELLHLFVIVVEQEAELRHGASMSAGAHASGGWARLECLAWRYCVRQREEHT